MSWCGLDGTDTWGSQPLILSSGNSLESYTVGQKNLEEDLPPPQPSTLASWGRGTAVITEICPESLLSFPMQKRRLQRESHQNLWVLAENYPNWDGEWNPTPKPFSIN